MKKSICLAAAAALILVGCGESGGKKAFRALADLQGARIAVKTGTMFPEVIDQVIPNVKYKHYDVMPELAEAVLNGKADAMCGDMPVIKHIVAQYPNLVMFPDVLAPDSYGFAVGKGSELGAKCNRALRKLKERGAVRELASLWFSADEGSKVLPRLDYKEDFDGSAGVIRYGYDNVIAPMSYAGPGGEPMGLELAIVSKIAYELNMKLEFTPMAFAELLPALAAGKVNMVGGSMSITEERLKTVDFVGPYIEGGVVLAIKKSRMGK